MNVVKFMRQTRVQSEWERTQLINSLWLEAENLDADFRRSSIDPAEYWPRRNQISRELAQLQAPGTVSL